MDNTMERNTQRTPGVNKRPILKKTKLCNRKATTCGTILQGVLIFVWIERITNIVTMQIATSICTYIVI